MGSVTLESVNDIIESSVVGDKVNRFDPLIADTDKKDIPKLISAIEVAVHNTTYNTRAGIFIMARLLQIIPEVYERQFPDTPVDAKN